MLLVAIILTGSKAVSVCVRARTRARACVCVGGGGGGGRKGEADKNQQCLKKNMT